MQKGTIKLYGEIWEWGYNSASNFIEKLNALDGKVDVINIHTHCKGGDVLEGIAIYNAIKASKTPVDFYVDGVAASMATIIMLACRKIYMSSNAFLMIHAPSGGAWGTAKTLTKAAKVLKAMEQNFAGNYMAKTGKTEAEVKEWLDGDNWFSSQQALDDNIIDGIVDAVDTQVKEVENVQQMSASMLYQQFVALTTDNNTKQKTKNPMNKTEVIARYGLTSVTAESSEDEIYSAIEDKMNAAASAQRTAEEALKNERKSQITAMLATAKTQGKITDANFAKFEAIGVKAGIDSLQTALDAIHTPVTITDLLGNQPQGVVQATAPATFSELVALGDSFLAKYKNDHPAEYARLYKAEFGRDYK